MHVRRILFFIKNKSGQSLVEMIIALGVAGILIGAAATGVGVYLRSNNQTKQQEGAILLAQELMDNMRSWSEGDWNRIANLNKTSANPYSLITSSTPYTASSSAETVTIDNKSYARSFYVDSVYRTLCGAGYVTSTTPDGCVTPGSTGVATDTLTYLITVRVALPAPLTQVMQLQEYFTRSGNTVFQQNDWVGGSGQESFSTSSGFPSAVNDRFASSSGIGFTTSSQIVLTGVVSNGGLVWATSSNPTAFFEESWGIVASSSYMYLIGTQSSRWRLEKRHISTGAIDAVDAGLVGYWPFDEGRGIIVTDYSTSGSAGEGVLTTGPVWATGKYGGGLYFNGTSSYVSVADSVPLLPSAAITMSFWARKDGPGSLPDVIQLSKGGNYLSTCYSAVSGAIFALNTPTQIYSISSIPCDAIGGWHHYAGTYDGSINKIYIDGVLTGSSTDTGAIVDTAGALNIGRYDGGSYQFNGLMDEVRIYNRALSATEIQTLYAATPPTTWGISSYESGTDPKALAIDGSFIYVVGGGINNMWTVEKRNILDGSIWGTGASAYWSFNEGQGLSVIDVSGNGLTGTLAGGVWTSAGAMSFDGSDYVTVSSAQGLNPLASTTASAWFKTTSTVASTKILGKTTACASTGYLIWMDENALGDGRVSWFVGNGPWLDSPATSTYNDGAWHHVVGTYDGNISRLYVDGNLSNSATLGVENPSSAAVFEIGGSSVGCGSGFVGEIDDVRIYQRALSASEVSTMYSNGTSTATSTWSITANQSATADTPTDIATDGTDLYIVGGAHILPVNDVKWHIERRNAQSGVLVWASTTQYTSSDEFPLGVALDSSYVYVAGYDIIPGNAQWRILKMNKSNSATVWATTTNPSSNADIAEDIAVDSSYVYTVGSDASLGSSNEQWRIEKRDISNGLLIWATSSNFTSNNDVAYALTIDDTYMYVAGAEADGQLTAVWRVEKRALSDGALVWAQQFTGSTYSNAYAIDDDTQFIYVSGSQTTGAELEWRIEKRLK